MTNRSHSLALVPAVFFLITIAVHGQTTVAELRGNVTDASGAGVASAVVIVQNVDTNDVRRGSSDPAGNYIFAQLPVGRYNLTVEAPGFQKFVLRDIALQVDARRRKDARSGPLCNRRSRS